MKLETKLCLLSIYEYLSMYTPSKLNILVSKLEEIKPQEQFVDVDRKDTISTTSLFEYLMNIEHEGIIVHFNLFCCPSKDC